MNLSFRQLLFFFLLFIVTIVSVTWIVVGTIRSEAEQSRKAMEDVAGTVVGNSIENTIDIAAGKSGGLVKDGIETGSQVIDEIGDAAGSVLEKMRVIISESKGTQSEEFDNSELRQSASKSKDPTRGLSPSELISDVFKFGQDFTHGIDNILQEIAQLDEGEEAKVGAQIHKVIRRQYIILDDPILAGALQKLSEPFLLNRKRKRKSIRYQFFIVDDSEVNAFAHIGGYVYVNKGLLDAVNNDQELQFVLGHEIAHVDLGHCSHQMSLVARASEALGESGATIVQLGYQAIALGYSEDKEFEADASCCLSLPAVRPAALSFLQRIKPKFDRGIEVKADDVFGTAIRELNNHLRTHPPTEQRIARIKALK